MKCALIYDFDGTLAEGNCAQHGLLPELDVTDINNFWSQVKERAKENDGDEILSYLGLLAEQDENKGTNQLSESALLEHGKLIPLFPGVDTWFERINGYAFTHGLELYHYIISSGLDVMIRGTEIGHYFRKIYACK